VSESSAALRAETLLSLGRTDEATTVLTTALATDPHDPGLIRLLASARLAAGQPEAARDAAARAIAIEPDYEWGHRILSEALSKLGQHDMAVRAAAESQRLAPMQWRTHTQRALVSGRAGHASDAMTAAGYAVHLAPTEPDAHFVLGYAAKLAGDPVLAEQAYQRTLALKPDHAMALNNLSTLKLKQPGGLRAATRGFGSALAADPQLDIARRNLSVVARRYMRRFHFGIVLAYLAVSIADSKPDGALGTDHVSSGSRLAAGVLGGAALVLLLGAAVVVDMRLPASLRPYFRRLPTTDKWLGAWLVVDLGALLLISLVAVPATYDGRSSLSSSAWVLLLAGLVLSYRQRFLRWSQQRR
jgi:tetratricopeptide (TPR) repeat protein